MIQRIIYLLQGKTPSSLQLLLIYGSAAVTFCFTLFLGENLIIAIMLADWVGGVFANSFQSTRRYWATLPVWWVYAFWIVHLLEIPIFLYLIANEQFIYGIVAVLIKLTTFTYGQYHFRSIRV